VLESVNLISDFGLHNASAGHLPRRFGRTQLREVHADTNWERKNVKQLKCNINDFCLDDEMGADVSQKHAGISRSNDPLKLRFSISGHRASADAAAPSFLKEQQRFFYRVGNGREDRGVYVAFGPVSDGRVNAAFTVEKASGVSFANHMQSISQNTTIQQVIDGR
jgi:hypothetical protein